ncbi:S-layer homology domain-containing protein [Dysosmobacter sp.]|uniref:S-layer homology domain-containing protein n=1 Tax=Dysosmobacter sp. TaxID=2591382 RepID=UPI002673A0DB|nr:S-layer homology domain-containing protein [Dysosmobacter sp.]MCI7282612.1 S-layer homology domain-containing protein [Dysosmobacter sp.]
MEKVTPGTVAVIVHEDGTEKIVSTSMVTEDGIVLTVSGTQTVKVIDNAKSFMDVPKSNVSYNEIASLSAREIMVGKTDDKFDLHNSVTLNQIANVAGRIVGAVDVKDYNAGIVWGAENGLKTGNVAATHGDVLKALYVAAGSPVVEDTSILARFSDSTSIPADLVAAATWAAQNGILKGTADGNADLSANVTRGQACALAGRTMGTLA